MRTARPPQQTGFTLVEILVSVSVLLMLIFLVAQITNGVSKATEESQKHMTSDSQARGAMGRLAQDLERMSKRADLDFRFAKQSGNDSLYFITEVTGYFDHEPSLNQSGFSLAGYRINSNHVLERLGKGLVWNEGNGDNRLNFLTYAAVSPNGSYEPLEQSTIAARSALKPSSNDVDYHVIGDAILRMEFCYLLKNGKLSTKPAAEIGSVAHNLEASRAPAMKDDASGGYGAGSRWYDTTAQRGYICVDATEKAAVWTALGWQDVTAVIVAIATLDPGSRLLAPNVQQLVDSLPDVAENDLTGASPQLMEQTWTGIVKNSSFASNSGLPLRAASAVRVYQRYFYLNSL